METNKQVRIKVIRRVFRWAVQLAVSRNWSKKTAIMVAVIAVIVLLLGGGSYALFLNGSGGPGATVGSVNLSRGLVGWWKMDGNTNDSTPYHDNGTISTIYGSRWTTDRKGKADSAYSSTGNTVFTAPDASQLDVETVTVSAWVDTSESSAAFSEDIITKGSNNPKPYALYKNKTGMICFTDSDGTNGTTLCTTSSPADGKWHLITATRVKGGAIVLYVDDSAVATGTDAATASTANTGLFCVGEMCSGGGFYQGFKGKIDDVRIYNRAVTADEVKALYNSYNDPLDLANGENGLVGWWRLDGNAKDSTPYRDNGTKVGTGSWGKDRKGRDNGAYKSAGNSGITIPDAPQLDITSGTFFVWIYATSTPSYQGFVAVKGSINIYVYEDGTVCSTWGTTVCSSTSVVDGKWHLVTVTGVSNGQHAIYVDEGTPNTVTNSTLNANTDMLCLGDHIDGTGTECDGGMNPSFPGYIDDFRIYNRVLTAQEVSNLYESYNAQLDIGGDGQTNGINLLKGLVGYWNMNGNTKDNTPYRDNGTLGSENVLPSLTTDRKGRANSAYNFTGSASYISISNAPQLDTETLTVAVWVNTTSSSEHVLDKYGPSVPFSIFIENDGTVAFGDSGYSAHSTSKVNDGQWHFIVGTRTKGVGLAIYIDGVLQGTGPDSTASTLNGNDVTIGSDPGNVSQNYKGKIDDVRIYNRVLTSAEIQALYDAYS